MSYKVTEEGNIATIHLDGEIDMDITMVLATGTFSIETVIVFPGSDEYEGVTITCQALGEWSSTDTEITFSSTVLNFHNGGPSEYNVEITGDTSAYVLYEDTLTLNNHIIQKILLYLGFDYTYEERIYTRQ